MTVVSVDGFGLDAVPVIGDDQNLMKILVDADAFPNAAKEILLRAVERLRIPLVMVANQPMRLPRSDLLSLLLVEEGPDVADDRIVEIVEAEDLVVTADVPLADRVVSKGATALDPRGTLYTEDNVKERLATRNLMQQLREEGVAGGGPAGFSRKDAQAFARELDRFLAKAQKAPRRESPQ